MAYIKTDSQHYSDIADAIRTQNLSEDTYKPAEMANAILETKGIPRDRSFDERNSETWVRPSNYPDLDSLDLTNFNGVYLTYDLSKTDDYGWIGVYATVSSGKYKVERGHILNGEFVVDYAAADQSSGAYFRQALDEANGMVQLWRVYSDSANITRVAFVTNTATNAQNKPLNVQPCVERYGRLPGLTSINSTNPPTSTSSTAGGWGTVWLEHDKVYDVTNLTTMAYAWMQCYNLKKIEFPGWNVSKVTTMTYAWQACRSLKELDCSGWTTTALTNISYAWNACNALLSLDIHDWNVSKVTTMAYAWADCYSLGSLDLSQWETNALTNLDHAWAWCYSLPLLNIKTWNVSKVTTLNYTWASCQSLVSLDLRGWQVQKVTTFAYAWNSCVNLKYLYINDWEPILVTTMAYAWSSCYSLVDLDVKNWRPAVLANLSYAWNECHCLRILDLADWALTKITNLSYTWRNCFSLKELKTDSWRPTGTLNLNYAFYNDIVLDRIDLSTWGEDLTVNNLEYVTNACYGTRYVDFSSIKHNTQSGNYFRYAMLNMPRLEYANLDNLDMPSITGAAGYPNLVSLVDFYPPIIYVNFSVAAAVKLSRDSVLRIINGLPEVTTTRTCTLGQTNKLKVTAEEIAIATEKGWTIA